MKNILIIKLSFLVLLFLACFASGQPKSRRSRPVAVTPAVSQAQSFYNEGVGCEKKDFDCQVSNFTKAINLELKTREVFRSRGNAYLAREEFEKSIADFTKCIELDPNDVVAFKLRGQGYLRIRTNQAVDSALADFASAVELEPKDTEALNYRGLAYLRKGLFEKASADFDKVLSINSGNADAYRNRGEVYRRTGETDKALEYFSKAISLKPTEYSLWVSRSDLYISQKKPLLAMQDLSKAIEVDSTQDTAYSIRGSIYYKEKRYAEAVKDYSKLIELKPKSHYFLAKRGIAYRAQKNLDGAMGDLTKAIEIDPASALLAYENRASIYLERKEFDKAIEDSEKAINIYPGTEEAYLALAAAKFGKTGDASAMTADANRAYANMITNATREIDRDPQNLDAYIKRGQAHTYTQNYAKAFEDYTKATVLNPTSTDALTGLGYSSFGAKNYPSAIQAYTKAIEMNPTDETSYVMLSTANSASKGYQGSADFDVQLYSRGIVANPKSIQIYYYRGNSYKSLKDYPKAITDYQKAMELYETDKDPVKFTMNVRAANGLAECYHEQKDDVKAVEVLTKVIENNLSSGYAYFIRGSFYEFKLNNTSKALEDYNKGGQMETEAAWRKINTDAVARIKKAIADKIEADYALAECKKAKRRQTANAIFGAIATGIATVSGGPVITSPTTGQPIVCK